MSTIANIMNDLQETAKNVESLTQRLTQNRTNISAAKNEATGHMETLIVSVSADIDVLKRNLIEELNIALKAMADNYEAQLNTMLSLYEIEPQPASGSKQKSNGVSEHWHHSGNS